MPHRLLRGPLPATSWPDVRGELTQSLTYKGQKLLGGRRVAIVDLRQNTCDVAHGGAGPNEEIALPIATPAHGICLHDQSEFADCDSASAASGA
jgi:hypothetical protein